MWKCEDVKMWKWNTGIGKDVENPELESKKSKVKIQKIWDVLNFDFWFWILTSRKESQLFNRCNQLFKTFRLIHGEISQYLTIKRNSFLTEHMNKLRISQPFFTNSRIDTGDP